MAGKHNIIFYEDGGRIVGNNPIWVQTTLVAVVRMFNRVRLLKNLDKDKAMVCNPGFIWGQQGTAAYKRREKKRGSHVLGAEENQGELRGVRGGAMAALSLHRYM